MTYKDALFEKPCRDSVFSADPVTYGPLYKRHLLDQYHRYLESLWFIGTLKQRVNSYFLTMNTVLLATLGVSFANVGLVVDAFRTPLLRHTLPIVGVVICVVWWAILYSYRQRTTVKLHIIDCIESRLPLAPFRTERELIVETYKGSRYIVFRTSLFIPWIFALLYLLLFFFL